MKKIILCCFLSIAFANMQAQNAPENKLGAWYMYNGSHQLSAPFSLQTMAHFRYFETSSEFQQGIYRLGLNYKLNPKFNFTLGLSYAETDTQYNTPSALLTEYRIYEDFNFNTNLTKLKLRHRFRFEHRFLELQGEKSSSKLDSIRLECRLPPIPSTGVFMRLMNSFSILRESCFHKTGQAQACLYKLNNHIKFKAGIFPSEIKKCRI